jgi:hypothetical protein
MTELRRELPQGGSSELLVAIRNYLSESSDGCFSRERNFADTLQALVDKYQVRPPRPLHPAWPILTSRHAQIAVQLEYSTARYGRCKLRQTPPHGRSGRGAGKAAGGGAGYGTDARLAAGPGGGQGGMMGMAWQREVWARDRGQGYGGGEVRYDDYDDWSQGPDPDAAHFRGGAHGPRQGDAPAVPLCMGARGGQALPPPHSHKRSHEHAGLAHGHMGGLGGLLHGPSPPARHAEAYGHSPYHHHAMAAMLDPGGGFSDGGGRMRGMDADDGRGGMELRDGYGGGGYLREAGAAAMEEPPRRAGMGADSLRYPEPRAALPYPGGGGHGGYHGGYGDGEAARRGAAHEAAGGRGRGEAAHRGPRGHGEAGSGRLLETWLGSYLTSRAALATRAPRRVRAPAPRPSATTRADL